MKYLIYKQFSGVGYCNQLFSLETALYLSSILNRKLILLIENPLCHIGRSNWNYGKILDFFDDSYISNIPYNIEVHYGRMPPKIKELIDCSSLTEKIILNTKMSQVLFIDEDLNNSLSKEEITKHLTYRTRVIFNMHKKNKTYLYISESNASRCFYNFLTSKYNYNIMYDICSSIKLRSIFYETLENIVLDPKYISIHFRFGDARHPTNEANENANKITKNIYQYISNINPDNYPIYIMCDRKDVDILDKLKDKYTIKFTDEIIQQIDFNKVFPNYKSHEVVKFLIEKLICEKAESFMGTDGSTVSNHIHFMNYINGKQYNYYTNKIIQYRENVPTWSINGIGGAGISWRVFFKDNIIKKNNYQFITLTNDGYMELTQNLIISLTYIGLEHILKVYCIGENCFNFFKSNYPNCKLVLIDTNVDYLKNWCQYYAGQNPNVEGKKRWANITSYKFYAINKELENNNDVIFTDGDIVFRKNPIPYLLENIKDNDLLIQNDEQTENKPLMCTGFFYMKSNDLTKSITNFENISKNINSFQNDQQYLRRFAGKLKLRYLNLNEFPNGKYWRDNIPQSHYIIHFNYDTGTTKIRRMKQFKKWYLSDKKVAHKRCIIRSKRQTGFFSALLGLIYEAYNYKQRTNMIPYILWENTKYMAAHNDNVFNYFFIQNTTKPDLNNCEIIDERGYRLKYIQDLAKTKNISFREQFNLIIKEFCVLKPQYQEKIDNIIKKLEIKNRIGFHLRQTDRNTQSKGIIYSGPSIKFVKENVIKDEIKDFYLATDCRDTFMDLRNNYNCVSICNIRSSGSRGIHHDNDIEPLNFNKGEEALLEAWILSYTKKLYRTTSNVTIFTLCLNPNLNYTDLCKVFKKEIEKEKKIDKLFIESFLDN